MKALSRLLSLLAVLLLPAAALADGPDFTFALHGFVSMSGAYQTGAFGLSEGQQSLYAAAEPATDKNSLTFDVRQSRFNFSVKGPQVMFGATPTAVLEIDFFQGFGGGAFGDVSLLNRMRTAYTQLDWGNHKIQIGQQNDLVFAQAPTSLSHIAFPLAYATGNIGWRRPGIFGFHKLPVADGVNVELAWELGRGNWNDAASGIGGGAVNAPNGISLAEASGTPAVEGRVTVSGKGYSAYVAGHYASIDTDGVGATGADPSSMTTSAIVAGGKVNYMGVTAAASFFTGSNTGPLLGQLIQFSPIGTDVSTTGYWAQLGYNVTKEFSLWALYGNQKPDAADATASSAARRENTTMNFQAMYRDGGFGASVEYVDFKTTYGTYAGGALTATTDAKASQMMFTGTYFF
jgi:hypothetical protein